MIAPQNQASALFSVVPVFPHSPETPILAWVPVPLVTTVSRMCFASLSMLGETTWVRSGSFSPPLIGWPSLSVTFGEGDRAIAGMRRQGAADPGPVVCDRAVGIGPAERGDPFFQSAEHHRRVGRDRFGVAHRVDRVGDRAGSLPEALALQAP